VSTPVSRWVERFGLRPELSETACVDLLLTYSGPSIYRQLVVDYGWATPAYTAWVRSILTDLLATPRATTKPSAPSVRTPALPTDDRL
jgi:hypothetical protein